VSVLLYLAPAALLLLSLWLGRYPGEKRIRALLGVTAFRVACALVRATTRCAATLPRGGRLIAASLAGRAPPQRSHP
jgi:hypothetical protein